MSTRSRRSFISASLSSLTALAVASSSPVSAAQSPGGKPEPGPSFPTQEPDLVREMVGVSHRDLARVKELVTRQPTLARAAWDWGYGDWEDALGAASHVGRRDIADLLLTHGARPTIFSATMLGQLDVVKTFIAAAPGIQRTKGPHGITLLSHAKAGGAGNSAMVEYLKSVGGADENADEPPLTPAEMAAIAGAYVYGSGKDERIDIAVAQSRLTITRVGRTTRNLFHVGSHAFFPNGAEAVRISFAESAGGVLMTIRDPDVVLTARRS